MIDEHMREAIVEAQRGLVEGGIPIGAVLVRSGRIIGRGRNRRVQDSDPVMHAEIDCLRNAGRIKSYRDTVMYSTLMPCHMCAGAIIQFGIGRLVVGDSKTFTGAGEMLESCGVEIVDLNLSQCREMLSGFIASHPEVWNEDIGNVP